MDANFQGTDYSANFKDVVAKNDWSVERIRGRMATPGSDTVYQAGTVMGIVTATGKVAPYATGNTDGTQTPVGVLENSLTLAADGSNGQVVLIVKGTLYKDRLVGLDAGAITALSAKVFVEGGDNLIRLP